MPIEISNKKVFSLSEVTASIERTIEARYKSAFWMTAEMNKLNYYKHSGHCYPDLIERNNEKVIAQVRATLWKGDFQNINRKFLTVLKEPLKDGIKILLLAKISFDALHGLSIQILDIDPGYTLGDLEKEKQDTIKRLQTEHVFNTNKSIALPLLPQRIAIISVETSKGYADFLQVIKTNSWNYKFFFMLFPSLLQGDKAAQSIISQLNRIKKVKQHFDAVAIIRGGGGDVGLSCYNNYNLAKTIAEFPLPVLTGIGHSTNETVSEMIAHTNAITPTKLAEFLIQKFHNVSVPVKNAEKYIAVHAKQILDYATQQLLAELKLFKSVTENMVTNGKYRIAECIGELQQHSEAILLKQHREIKHKSIIIIKDSNNYVMHKRVQLTQAASAVQYSLPRIFKQERIGLKHIEEKIQVMHPENILKRGFSITTLNGKLVQQIKNIKAGDLLQTKIYSGIITSEVITTKKNSDE
ncbi:MAG: exodeoxyribonuclease VII large subunit [Chitinophagales bacterium]|nr:exodeoxyribonuclease VII large subunit [Chitinophagales bacterium]